MDHLARPAAITTACRGPTSPCQTSPWAMRRTAAVSITLSNSSSLPPLVHRTTMMVAHATPSNLRVPWRAARHRHIRRHPRCCQCTLTRALDRQKVTPMLPAAVAAVEAHVHQGDPGGIGVTIRAPAKGDTRMNKMQRQHRRHHRGSQSTLSPSHRGQGGAKTLWQLGPVVHPRVQSHLGGSDPSAAGEHLPSCRLSMMTCVAHAPAQVQMTSLTNCLSGELTVECGYPT